MFLTKSSGMIIGPIASLLGMFMNGIFFVLNKLGIPNIGLAIIIMTILIYMAMLPLTVKQQKFSKLQRKMQPELNKINKKYEGRKDPESMERQQAEIKEVYGKYGVSATGSCVQLIIQMPILLALYRVFYNIPAYITSIKDYFGVLSSGKVVSGSVVDVISNTSGFQDIMQKIVTDYKITTVSVDFTTKDTSALNNYIIDVLYKLPKSGWENLTSYFDNIGSAVGDITPHINKFNYAFGKINISDTPWNIIKTSFAGHEWLVLVLALLIPVLAYATQLLNIKLMPQAGGDNDQMAKQMKTMNTMMPLMSLFFCFITPTGLGIYWVVSALVRAVQQFFVNKHIENLNLDNIMKKNQEKVKKKREKLGISEDQIRQAAMMKTRNIESKANVNVSSAQKELELEKAQAAKSNAKAGSMASKANLVKEFNEKNNRK